MTPTKVTLEIIAIPASSPMRKYSDKQIQLRAQIDGKSSTVIESTPLNPAKSSTKTIMDFRKYGEKYAKRFSIPFIDATA